MSTMWISSPKPYRLIRTPDVQNFKLEEKKDGCFGYPISYVLDTLEGYVRKSKLIYDKVTEVTGNPVDLPEASQKVVMSKLSYIRLLFPWAELLKFASDEEKCLMKDMLIDSCI